MLKLKTQSRSGVGIYHKMLTGYMLIIAVVLSVTAFMTYRLVRNYIIQSNETELVEKAQYIAITQKNGFEWKQLRRYQSLVDAKIVLVNPDYIATQSPPNPSSKKTPDEEDAAGLAYTEIVSNMDRSIFEDIFAGGTVRGVEDVEFLTAKIVYAGVPLQDAQGETVGAMMLFRTVADVDVMWMRIAVYLIVAAACAMVVAVAFTSIFSRSITKPLYIMNEVARAMAAGDYSRHAPVAQADEIGQLAETFNVLADRLNDVIENLQNEKGKLEQLFEAIAEGIVAVERDGRVFHVNAPALEMLEIDRWEAEHARAGEPQRHVLSMLVVCMDSGEKESAVWTSDSGRAIHAVASPMLGAEGACIGAVCLLRDVSEETRLEQLRREYIANVSHELRTPLTGIRGMVEPLMDGVLETDEEKNSCYQVIYRETRRLEKLIGEMLDLSRLQDGRAQMELEAIRVEPTLERAVESVARLAEDAGIQLTVNAEAGTVCMGNEERIIQVLIILLDNALSFTPTGGHIEACARRQGRFAELSVRDDGAGIEPKDVPYIWERFYKADKSRMRTKGTGLGLAIAKKVVELMGGTIGVQSEVGKGSTFTIRLPSADAPVDS